MKRSFWEWPCHDALSPPRYPTESVHVNVPEPFQAALLHIPREESDTGGTSPPTRLLCLYTHKEETGLEEMFRTITPPHGEEVEELIHLVDKRPSTPIVKSPAAVGAFTATELSAWKRPALSRPVSPIWHQGRLLPQTVAVDINGIKLPGLIPVHTVVGYIGGLRHDHTGGRGSQARSLWLLVSSAPYPWPPAPFGYPPFSLDTLDTRGAGTGLKQHASLPEDREQGACFCFLSVSSSLEEHPQEPFIADSGRYGEGTAGSTWCHPNQRHRNSHIHSTGP